MNRVDEPMKLAFETKEPRYPWESDVSDGTDASVSLTSEHQRGDSAGSDADEKGSSKVE
jgi:hypothetical protein